MSSKQNKQGQTGDVERLFHIAMDIWLDDTWSEATGPLKPEEHPLGGRHDEREGLASVILGFASYGLTVRGEGHDEREEWLEDVAQELEKLATLFRAVAKRSGGRI